MGFTVPLFFTNCTEQRITIVHAENALYTQRTLSFPKGFQCVHVSLGNMYSYDTLKEL